MFVYLYESLLCKYLGTHFNSKQWHLSSDFLLDSPRGTFHLFASSSLCHVMCVVFVIPIVDIGWWWLGSVLVYQSVSDNDTSDASSFLNRFDGVKCAGVLFGLEYWWRDTRISRLGTVGNKNEWTEDNIGSWINSNNAKRKQKSKKRRSIKSRTSPGSPPDELTFYISTTWSGVGIIVTTTTCWSFHLIVSCL